MPGQTSFFKNEICNLFSCYYIYVIIPFFLFVINCNSLLRLLHLQNKTEEVINIYLMKECRCNICKIIRDVIFPILKDLSTLLVHSIFRSFSNLMIPVFLLEYCLITQRICCLLFKRVFWRLICDKTLFQNSILSNSAHCFSSRAHTLFHLGPYVMERNLVPQRRSHDKRRMNTSEHVLKF